jgi:tungstate transport system permease protein
LDLILEGIIQAFKLLLQGDPEVVRIVLLSLGVSLSATVISLVVGVGLGTALGLSQFPGRRILVSIINTGMGAPPTVVGLVVTIFLWRNGPLGLLRIMYTPAAMVIAQFLISLPIITGFTLAAIQQIDKKMQLQLMALGASRSQMVWLLLKESRLPLLAAVMAGFGAIISEVGASMMVGGNLTGQTRVLTTAIVMETSKGEFAVAIALSIILMLLVYGINLLLTWVQQRGKES